MVIDVHVNVIFLDTVNVALSMFYLHIYVSHVESTYLRTVCVVLLF